MLRIISLLILCLTAIVSMAHQVSIVGTSAITGISNSPEAIVLGNNLVVFYQKTSGSTSQGHFAVASIQNGNLVWEEQPYSINNQNISSEGYAPVPALLNGRLFVFGGKNRNDSNKNDQAKILYNSVADLAALKTNSWKTADPFVLRYEDSSNGLTTIRPHKELKQISAIDYLDSAGKLNILLTYFEHQTFAANQDEHKKFSYASCQPNTQFDYLLQCIGGKVYSGNNTINYNAPTHLTKAGGSTFLFVRNGKNNPLTAHQFNVSPLGFSQLYSSEKIDLSGVAIATVEDSDGDLRLYFKREGGDGIFKTFISNSADFTGDNWGNVTQVFDSCQGAGAVPVQTHKKGLKAVVFNNQVYVFFVNKQTGALSYFIDEVTICPR